MDISPEYQDILKGIKEAKILTPGEKKALAKQRAELSPNLAKQSMQRLRQVLHISYQTASLASRMVFLSASEPGTG